MKKSLVLVISAILLITTLVSCGGTDAPEETKKPLGSSIKTQAPKTEEHDTKAPEATNYVATELAKKPEEYTYNFKFEAPTGNPRDIVYDYMYKMATVEWTASKTWTTRWKEGEEGDYGVNLTYTKGNKYHGVTYTETSGALDLFEQYVDNGVFTPNSEYHTELVGNHCSASMVLAYQQILDFSLNGSLKPTRARTGLLKFPDGLEVPPSRSNNPDDWISATMFEHNGQQAIYDGYAQLDKGDILYKNIDGSGHTRMVHKVEIQKTAAGKIVPSRSYVYCLEQTNAWDADKDSTWWIDSKYSFSQLYDTFFMPVTFEIFHEENPTYTDAYIVMDGQNTPDTIQKALQGTVESNYPLNYVRITIKDANGNIVGDVLVNNLARNYKVNLRNYHYQLGIDKLASGTYTYTLRAGIARGGVDVESFQFTK